MDSNYAIRYATGLAERWWTFVIRGVAAVLFGSLAIAVPGSSLRALVILWGAYAVVNGVFALMLAAQRDRSGLSWGWLLVEGIVGIGAGVATFFWPTITALALLTVIGVWAVLTGIAEIAAAIQLRRLITGEWLLATSGVLSIAFGILVLLRPASGALALVWLIGAYAIVFGVLLIGLGLRLNQWRRTGERPIRTGGAPTAA